MDPLVVLGLSGSLRRASLNTMALHAAQGLAPEGMRIDLYEDLGAIPPYNEDEKAKGLPASVVALREKIRAADALLIVSPEYNHSIPGFLKNAIDWVSRPPDVPLTRKPVAIMGASPGMLGTVRMQAHLREVLAFFDAFVIRKPEVYITGAPGKFGSDGALTDSTTRDLISQLLTALRDETRKFKAGGLVP
jgi:chromate reductase